MFGPWPPFPGRPGLRRRVVRAFAGFGFALACLFAVVMWAALHMAEDRIIFRYLELEADDYVERLDADPDLRPPESRWLLGTFRAGDLPPAVVPYADADDGTYELGAIDDGTDPFLLIRTLDDGRRLLLHLDAVQIEIIDASFALLGLILVVTVTFVTGVGVVLGGVTAKRAIAPVAELAARVQRFDVRRDAVFDADGFNGDEVGLLARALADSTARSRAFLDRERRFTRDASHELRTPVTVVQGAVELLESLPAAEHAGVGRPLGRIRRAADDMGRLIDAFLWLAREEDLSEGVAPRSLDAEARALVERYRHVLEGKPVDVTIDVEPDAAVDAPPGILGIVLGNLIGNAFFFTARGAVTIRGDGACVEVQDTGPGMTDGHRRGALEAHVRGPESRGFGLGLAIVRDLCRRFGWRLTLEPGPGGGTLAVVHFRDVAAPGGRSG